jgi:hypothetical protein
MEVIIIILIVLGILYLNKKFKQWEIERKKALYLINTNLNIIENSDDYIDIKAYERIYTAIKENLIWSDYKEVFANNGIYDRLVLIFYNHYDHLEIYPILKLIIDVFISIRPHIPTKLQSEKKDKLLHIIQEILKQDIIDESIQDNILDLLNELHLSHGTAAFFVGLNLVYSFVYESALEQLEYNPNDLSSRKWVLKVGRWLNIDEQVIQNDINTRIIYE